MVGLDHHPAPEGELDDVATSARNRRYGLVLFSVYLVIYGGFVLLNAFRPDLAEVRVLAGLNLAIVYGMALIFAAFGLAVVYGWLCRAPAHAPSNATGVGGEERR